MDTAWHHASRQGYHTSAKHSFTLDQGDRYYQTHLLVAAAQGHTEICRLLLRYNVQVLLTGGCEDAAPQAINAITIDISMVSDTRSLLTRSMYMLLSS